MVRHRLTLIALLAASAVAPGWGSESVKVTGGVGRARLVVGGKLIAMFRTANGDLSPMDRAKLAAERLRSGLRPGRRETVSVEEHAKGHAVHLDGKLLMLATSDEAEERGESTLAVATRWANNLRSAIGGKAAAGVGQGTRRRLVLDDERLLVPLGESRSFTVRGGPSGKLWARAADSDMIGVAVPDGSSTAELHGLKAGTTSIRFSRGGVELERPVLVQPWSAVLARTPEIAVTGASAGPALIRRALAQHALRALDLSEGCRAELAGPPAGLRALAPGEELELTQPVSASGLGHLPRKLDARVKVVNRALTPLDSGVLLYSNEPESVREYGVLFEGLVEAEAAARLLYHHQNRMGRAFTLQVDLINPGDLACEVQVQEGDAGPYIDPLQAGHRAGQKYLAAQTQDLGIIYEVPARGSLRIAQYRMEKLQTVSAISGIRSLKGGPLVVQIAANADSTPAKLRDDLLETARTEPHTYVSPRQLAEYRYRVGDRWTFIPIGRNAIASGRSSRKLFGNYGVLYDITVQIENPTDSEKSVRLMLAPEAGWARGVFVIDGKLIEAPQLAPPAEATLWTQRLAPGQHKKLTIQGIPVSGSAYPLSLVVRS